MNEKKEKTMRKVLQEGTWIRLSQGELYKITGKPIGEGGGSIVYPCKKISYLDGKITVSEIDYTATEKLRSGILLPEKISPHRWWIWILHRKDTGSEWRVQAVHSIG